MGVVLRKLQLNFVLVTGIELGISEYTQYFNERVLGLTNLSRNTELFHKYGFEDTTWVVQHYTTLLDINTFFEYFDPQYDIAAISCNIYDDCKIFFDEVTYRKTSFVLSPWDMGNRNGYSRRVFGDHGDMCYLYYRDLILDW